MSLPVFFPVLLLSPEDFARFSLNALPASFNLPAGRLVLPADFVSYPIAPLVPDCLAALPADN